MVETLPSIYKTLGFIPSYCRPCQKKEIRKKEEECTLGSMSLTCPGTITAKLRVKPHPQPKLCLSFLSLSINNSRDLSAWDTASGRSRSSASLVAWLPCLLRVSSVKDLTMVADGAWEVSTFWSSTCHYLAE